MKFSHGLKFGGMVFGSYVWRMDWQQIVALVIVAVTAALFIRARLRKRKSGLPCGSHCGSVGDRSARPTVIYHARKGERPRILVKMK